MIHSSHPLAASDIDFVDPRKYFTIRQHTTIRTTPYTEEYINFKAKIFSFNGYQGLLKSKILNNIHACSLRSYTRIHRQVYSLKRRLFSNQIFILRNWTIQSTKIILQLYRRPNRYRILIQETQQIWSYSCTGDPKDLILQLYRRPNRCDLTAIQETQQIWSYSEWLAW